ncbi:hypothetical protein [Nocardia pseudobrasiliensis]|uniref:Lipoprotein n=1 Tax=Nocardia pseudobrasiliensis TaxID=45979 RepID=A0A370HRZ5_9NOCA|nr:hypothetical protein [Nocardia pseudobrasiliensis]RDI61309.1 hypothetical protein DFR76_11433 [Nocardia pseudobrasiliensis]
MIRRYAAAMVALGAVSGCGAVHPEAGAPVADRYALPSRAANPPGAVRDTALAHGAFAEGLTGSMTSLGTTTDLTGTGVATVGPGAAPGESVVSHYGADRPFPYEVTTIVTTESGRYLTALALTDPSDTRLAVHCVLTDPPRLDPEATRQAVRGHCAGGVDLTGASGRGPDRDGEWNGKPVRLTTIDAELTLSGPVRGTIHQTTEFAEGSATPVRTETEVDLDAGGARYRQHLIRTLGAVRRGAER